MLHDRVKEGRQTGIIFVSAMGRIRRSQQLARGETVLSAGVNNGKIKLLVCCLQLNEKIKHHVDDSMGPCVFSVDLVNDNDRLEFVFKSLAQDKARLRLRSVMGVDDQQHAV